MIASQSSPTARRWRPTKPESERAALLIRGAAGRVRTATDGRSTTQPSVRSRTLAAHSSVVRRQEPAGDAEPGLDGREHVERRVGEPLHGEAVAGAEEVGQRRLGLEAQLDDALALLLAQDLGELGSARGCRARRARAGARGCCGPPRRARRPCRRSRSARGASARTSRTSRRSARPRSARRASRRRALSIRTSVSRRITSTSSRSLVPK